MENSTKQKAFLNQPSVKSYFTTKIPKQGRQFENSLLVECFDEVKSKTMGHQGTKQELSIASTKQQSSIASTKQELSIPSTKEESSIASTKQELSIGDTKQELSIADSKPEFSNADTKQDLQIVDFKWKLTTRENLNLKYAKVFSRSMSTYILGRLEKEVEYFSGDLLKVRVYGKWHNIPRKQVAFGEDGLSYAFSGNSLPSKPWHTCPIIRQLKDIVESLTEESFNFVLVNRYANGADHMGEHRDDEKDLVPKAPIASLSFGEVREFIFKHKDSRGKTAIRNIPPLKMDLESGSLLLMNYPTNKFWYHSLPVRKKASNVRVNLTFRKMVSK